MLLHDRPRAVDRLVVGDAGERGAEDGARTLDAAAVVVHEPGCWTQRTDRPGSMESKNSKARCRWATAAASHGLSSAVAGKLDAIPIPIQALYTDGYTQALRPSLLV
jgi:hypothetical protein